MNRKREDPMPENSMTPSERIDQLIAGLDD
jgi:hypothetical protein